VLWRSETVRQGVPLEKVVESLSEIKPVQSTAKKNKKKKNVVSIKIFDPG
jgi:hypothetical protein